LGPITGLILGDVSTGLEMGVTIEIMFLATVFVGTAIPCDEVMSTIISTAFAVAAGGDTSIGIAAALPLSVIGQIIRYIRSSTYHLWTNMQMEKAVARGDLKGMYFWHIVMPLIINLIVFSVPTFIAVYVSADIVQALINVIPEKLIDGIGVGAGMIGAVGLAMLLKSINVKDAWPYLLIGFFLSAFLNVNMIGISIIAVAIIAISIYSNQKNEKSKNRIALD
jgi:mannose/fructose/N-acetylgalactosamine-specific phosphotransferase system component IIC